QDPSPGVVCLWPVRRDSPDSLPGTAGARAEDRLALRAPEEVAAHEDVGAHPGAADEAGHAGAPVDVDLSPVVVLAGWTAHRLGRVLRPDRVDAAGVDAFRHQLDEVVPH